MLDSLFISVLNMNYVASYVILFVIIVRLLLKKTPKGFSYALWLVVLFRLLCPLSFESAIGLLPSNTFPIPQDIVDQAQPQIDTGISIIDNSINPILPVPPKTMASVNPLQIWTFIGSHIWLAGMAIVLIYSLIQLLKLKKKLIGATPLRDNIYLADHIKSPFVMGLVKPKIYLPSNISNTEQIFIIAHEKYHIKRFDNITRILGFIALAIHWFNPLAWFAFVLSGKDMEMSCDEGVMKKMNTDIRVEYAQSLLNFATGKKIFGTTLLTFGEGDTKGRVKNVMKYQRPELWVSILVIIAVICVVIVLMSNQKIVLELKERGVSAENLWKNRTEYVGDNSAVGNIIYEIAFPENMEYKSFELKTKAHPYEIIVYFDVKNDVLKTVDYGNGQIETVQNIDYSQLEKNVKIMFSLIGNVEKITFLVNNQNSSTDTKVYMRSNYDELFSKTESYKEFQTILTKI